MSKATEVEADATVVQAWLDVRAVGDDSIADEVSGWASDPTGLDPPADSRADGGGVAGDGPGVGPDNVAERARLKTTGQPPKRITVYRWLNPPKPGSTVIPFPEPAGRLNGGFWWWESVVAEWCEASGYGYVHPDGWHEARSRPRQRTGTPGSCGGSPTATGSGRSSSSPACTSKRGWNRAGGHAGQARSATSGRRCAGGVTGSRVVDVPPIKLP